MSALSLITSAVKNFQPTTSVLAGGASSVLVCAVGALLVAAGIAIPPIGFPELKQAVEVVARLMGVEMRAIEPGEALPVAPATASPTSTGSTSMAA